MKSAVAIGDAAFAKAWARPLDAGALDHIPPRQWLYGYKALRGQVGMFASPGGVGKTALMTAIVVACASGKKLLHDRPHKPMRVWWYNLEESRDEMLRRLKAACIHYAGEFSFEEIRDRIYLNSGRDMRGDGSSGVLNVATRTDAGTIMIEPDVGKMITEIRRLQVDMVVIDPFVMTHQVTENDNGDQERVVREFNRIANDADCAILLAHHTRKGAVAGDADSIRGAGAIIGAVRAAFTLAPMSEGDGEMLGIPPAERRFLVRLDDAKLNLAPRSADAEWFKLQSVALGNGTEEYPAGDHVQVATRWDPPSEDAGLTITLANEILDRLAKGVEGERFTMAKQSDRYAVPIVREMFAARGIDKPDRYCLTLLRKWLTAAPPVIRETEYFSPSQRKKRKGIEVNESNRPGGR
jgi:hypothetical protein